MRQPPAAGSSGATSRVWLIAMLFAVLVAGLPFAAWLDLRNLTEHSVHRQVSDFNAVITHVRGFYTRDVVGRVLQAHGHTVVTDQRYHTVPGGIPIPATFSIELGNIVGSNQKNIEYRFVSDFPFKHRAPHALDSFERRSLAALRVDPHRPPLREITWSGFTNRVRLIAPIVMDPTCVACHNTHPDSPKRDWKVGDVRGIQELSVTQPLATNIFSFTYLFVYFAFAAALSIGFITLQRRQARTIKRINDELTHSNDMLSSVASRVSRYISPQVYESIFSGRTDSTIHTKRKKLTIFFSDIKDFTVTTERLQPEELTALLNEYFTEMSNIAFKHGGTVDKFVGDAILVFFGDPESKGVAEDAQACLRMAVEMQHRLGYLNAKWRRQGLEQPMRVRMGINTGFCDVGNFGSADRMDYTVIGAEANLASRLESAAEPGTIVVSYETYALLQGLVSAHALPPIKVKGINRQVVPYVIDKLLDDGVNGSRVFSEHARGLDFYLDLGMVTDEEYERLREVLRDATEALEKRDVAHD